MARYPAGHVVPWHRHAAGQLVFAADGFFTVHVPDSAWVVPADRGVWVPPDVPHTLEARRASVLRSLYFAPSFAPLPDRAQVVRATPLVRELLHHLTEPAWQPIVDEARLRAARVLVDLIGTLDVAPLDLREPSDARARDATALLRDDPALDIDAVAHKVGASRRTLERQVRASTGMSLGEWHRRARMLRALELLADGDPVTSVATAVGYSTPSAFIAAFHAALGTTPARFFAR